MSQLRFMNQFIQKLINLGNRPITNLLAANIMKDINQIK